MLRLQRYIAQSGLCSRRQAEKLIQRGKVEVNGKVVERLGSTVDPQNDRVKVFGKLIRPEKQKIYIMLHKPVGYETTCKSTCKFKTVLDLVKVEQRIFPVGRLDRDSSGLLLLTNDGEWANQIMHPRYEHEKEYQVDLPAPLSRDQLGWLEHGVVISGKLTRAAKIKILSARRISITIHEGMNRQVRRMLDAVGSKAVKLKRVRIGKIKLGSLSEGCWREIANF